MNEKKSLYLKWRPTQLDEVVGQKSIVETLKQASINNDFAHAYILTGNHGCGKTSSARILASLMQCENVVSGRACGTCKACKTIHAGVCLDVREMDGAANRGIDNAKALIEAAQWSPQEFKKKIYILDEVHQLSKEAISALLKIMEEPPSYLVFILCTTEPNKILPTILSRCQRFNFSKISSKEIAQRLIFISKNENINIEEAAIDVISKMSRGSMRDAIGYLEQIGTFSNGKNITSSTIQHYFGITDRLAILNIVKSILEGNISLLLDQVNDIMMASIDCRQILFEISEVFRNIMVIKFKDINSKSIDLPDNEIKDLKKMGDSLSVPQILKLAHLFADVDKKISFNINERWITEAALINCVESLKNNKS